MPGPIPLDAAAVRARSRSTSTTAWKAIIETDIDGANSVARPSKGRPLLGRPRADPANRSRDLRRVGADPALRPQGRGSQTHVPRGRHARRHHRQLRLSARQLLASCSNYLYARATVLVRPQASLNRHGHRARAAQMSLTSRRGRRRSGFGVRGSHRRHRRRDHTPRASPT